MKTESAQPTDVKKEMGITHKDFYAELPVLLDNIPYQQTEDTIRFQLNGKNMEIVLGPGRGSRNRPFSATARDIR